MGPLRSPYVTNWLLDLDSKNGLQNTTDIDTSTASTKKM